VNLHPKFSGGSDEDHPKSDLADLSIFPHPANQSVFSSSQVKHIQKCANDPIRISTLFSPSWPANLVRRMLKINQTTDMFSPLRFRTAALPIARRRLSTTSIRGFHASPGAYIKVGDPVPSAQLREDTPGGLFSPP